MWCWGQQASPGYCLNDTMRCSRQWADSLAQIYCISALEQAQRFMPDRLHKSHDYAAVLSLTTLNGALQDSHSLSERCLSWVGTVCHSHWIVIGSVYATESSRSHMHFHLDNILQASATKNGRLWQWISSMAQSVMLIVCIPPKQLNPQLS